MAGNITPEMVALLNSGNKAELKAFLKLYTRPIYERALAITKNESDAIRVTRRVTGEITVLALRGKLENDIDAQLMELTDSCCSEDIFFARLVEDTLRDVPEDKYDGPTLLSKAAGPKWPESNLTITTLDKAALAAKNRADTKESTKPVQIMREAEPVEKTRPETDGAGKAAKRETEIVKPTPVLFEDDTLPARDYDYDDIDAEDEADEKPAVWTVLLIFLLSMVTLGLVWVLVVKLMYVGVLPIADFGFAQWFNANLFKLF